MKLKSKKLKHFTEAMKSIYMVFTQNTLSNKTNQGSTYRQFIMNNNNKIYTYQLHANNKQK